MFRPFAMERWQSTWENRVRFNLSESGVHPLTLDELLELASEPLDPGTIRFGYTQSNGTERLRERIADLYPGADASNVLVTVGGAEANFVSTWYLSEPGEPAAVMLPNYMQVPGLVEAFGMEPLPFHLREEDGWQPDVAELSAAISERVRFILVTNPNNPTGAVLGTEAMDAIVAEAESVGAWIVADEVYAGAEVEEGPPTPSFWGRYDRVLVTNSLSKAYGLPGLRLGWVVGPREVVADLWARTDYTTIGPAALSDPLATTALHPETRERILRRTRRIVRENLAVLEGWLDERPALFDWRSPDAGAICYIRCTPEVSSGELAEKLRSEQDVLIVPGDHFGMDRYVRLGFGPPTEELEEALARMGEAMDEVVGR